MAGLLEFARREKRQIAGYLLRGTVPLALLTALVVWSGVEPTSWIALFVTAGAFLAVELLLFGVSNPAMARRVGRELREMRSVRGSG